MGIFGFLFFLLDIFFFLYTLNNLLSTSFVTKHGLIHQVGDHICILENYVSVVSMIGYFPILVYCLRRKSSTYLKLDFNGVHFRDVFTKMVCLNGHKYLESKRLHHLCDCGIRVFTLLFVSTSIKRSMLM